MQKIVKTIIFLIFFFAFHEKEDTSVKQFSGGSNGYRITLYSTVVLSILGVFFSLFIITNVTGDSIAL